MGNIHIYVDREYHCQKNNAELERERDGEQ